MQCYRVAISKRASERLNEYIRYIIYDLGNPLAAKFTLEGIKRKINMLSVHPEICVKIQDEELCYCDIRKTRYKKYKIYFRVDKKEKIVYIVDILHELMDEENQLNQELF